MKHYSAERKEAVLRKLAPPMNFTVPEVAEAVKGHPNFPR